MFSFAKLSRLLANFQEAIKKLAAVVVKRTQCKSFLAGYARSAAGRESWDDRVCCLRHTLQIKRGARIPSPHHVPHFTHTTHHPYRTMKFAPLLALA
jgi:hypothetical protein